MDFDHLERAEFGVKQESEIRVETPRTPKTKNSLFDFDELEEAAMRLADSENKAEGDGSDEVTRHPPPLPASMVDFDDLQEAAIAGAMTDCGSQEDAGIATLKSSEEFSSLSDKSTTQSSQSLSELPSQSSHTVSRTISADIVPGADCNEVTDIFVPQGSELRVYLISDVHGDIKTNRDWLSGCLRNLDMRYFNCLLLPGDVSHNQEQLEEVLGSVATAFDVVCFCFGNHDVWVAGKKDHPIEDSIQKLELVNRTCQRLGVYTTPVRLCYGDRRLTLLPLWSWYHSSWDREPDLPSSILPPVDTTARVADYHYCKWGKDFEKRPDFWFGRKGSTSKALAMYFARRNEAWIDSVARLVKAEGVKAVGQILTYSHFCPRQELTLEKRFSFDQHLAKVSGSTILEEQLRSINPLPRCHVFGHTHVAWDADRDGVRYVSWPLGNKAERTGQTRLINDGGLLLLHEAGEWAPQQFALWSYYYDHLGKRDTKAKELAPWVVQSYAAIYPEYKSRSDVQSLLIQHKAKSLSGSTERQPLAPFFPGGADNNDEAFYVRHLGANDRWRCIPARDRAPLPLPCSNPGCLLCNHMATQEARSG